MHLLEEAGVLQASPGFLCGLPRPSESLGKKGIQGRLGVPTGLAALAGSVLLLGWLEFPAQLRNLP